MKISRTSVAFGSITSTFQAIAVNNLPVKGVRFYNSTDAAVRIKLDNQDADAGYTTIPAAGTLYVPYIRGVSPNLQPAYRDNAVAPTSGALEICLFY